MLLEDGQSDHVRQLREIPIINKIIDEIKKLRATREELEDLRDETEKKYVSREAFNHLLSRVEKHEFEGEKAGQGRDQAFT